jgi:hypothetical protein
MDICMALYTHKVHAGLAKLPAMKHEQRSRLEQNGSHGPLLRTVFDPTMPFLRVVKA